MVAIYEIDEYAVRFWSSRPMTMLIADTPAR
jgi:hypothetical protein